MTKFNPHGSIYNNPPKSDEYHKIKRRTVYATQFTSIINYLALLVIFFFCQAEAQTITVTSGTHYVWSSSSTMDRLIIQNNASVSFTGSVLTINGGDGVDLIIEAGGILWSNGKVLLNSGTTCEVSGTLEIYNGGTLSSPSTTIYSGGVLNITQNMSSATKYLYCESGTGQLDNYGTINWTGNGNIAGHNFTIDNKSGGVFNIQSDYSITHDGYYYQITINNYGTINKTTATGTTTFANLTFNNKSGGIMNVQSGTVAINCSGNHAGTFNTSSGCTLSFNNTYGTIYFDEGSKFQYSGTVSINNGTTEFTGTTNGTIIESGATVTFATGAVSGSGKLDVKGTLNWTTSGEYRLINTTISSGGVLNISGSNNKSFRYSGGSVYNNGTINWSGTGQIRGGSNYFVNNSGGVFNILTDAGMYYDGGGGGYITINNSGSIVKSSSSTANLNQTTFNNNGTLEIQSGTMSIAAGTSTGTFNIASGCTLAFNQSSQTHYLGNGSLFTNSGIVALSASTLNFNGTEAGASIASGTTMNFSGGTIEGSGKLTVNGTLNWSGGTNTLINTTISSGGVLNFTGTSNKYFRLTGGKIYNSGTINWVGSGSIAGASNGFVNNSGGVFDIQNDAGIYYDYGGGSIFTFVNSGIIKKTAGTGTFDFNHVELKNTGTIEVETGTLQASQALHGETFGSYTLLTGTYNIKGTFKFRNAAISTNNASIKLDGTSAQILNSIDNSDALTTFATNGASGQLILRNGKNLSTSASTFTNNGVLDLSTSVLSGSGNFVHSANASLVIGSPEGITQSASSGNIQFSGTRSYSASGNYTYNGTASQATGDGLPSSVNNLTFDNTAGITLTSGCTVGGTLTLTSGAVTTGGNILTLGTSPSNVGSLSRTSGKILGNFKRWFAASTVSDVLFPIGTTNNYRPANVSYTSAPESGGTLLASFTASNPGSSGLPLTDNSESITKIGVDGYWTLEGGDGLNGGTYSIDITADGFTGVSDYTKLHLLKRTDAVSNWTAAGTHSVTTGTNATPVLHRTGLTGFSQFGVGSTGDNPLPVELVSFTAYAKSGKVYLNWVTATEVNNFGFEIERSIADNKWVSVGFVGGNGNSNSVREYQFIDNPEELFTNFHNNSLVVHYRLKQIDTDGGFSYSNTIKLSLTNIPSEFALLQNHPNPFNPSTRISYCIPQYNEGNSPIKVSLKIYDPQGSEVQVLVNEEKAPGEYEVEFNAAGLPSGIYMYRLTAGTYVETKKMILLR